MDNYKISANKIIDTIDKNKLKALSYAFQKSIAYGLSSKTISNYLKELKKVLLTSHKFYIGDLELLPQLDTKKLGTATIKLPYPVTYLEGYMKEIKYIFLLIDGELTNSKNAPRDKGPCEVLFEGYVFLQLNNTSPDIWPYQSQVVSREGIISVDSRYISQYRDGAFEEITGMKKLLENVASRCISDSDKQMLKEALESVNNAFKNIIEIDNNEYPKEDLEMMSDAMRDAITFISVLNCTNLIKVKHDPEFKINRKLRKKNLTPEFYFHTLKLNKSEIDCIFEHKKMSEEDANIRMHWRRGHIKHCRTGNFWWNPHLVGKIENGIVDKEYNAQEIIR